jgi:hypothetical protein
MVLMNTLAFYNMANITAPKNFIVQAQKASTTKLFLAAKIQWVKTNPSNIR